MNYLKTELVQSEVFFTLNFFKGSLCILFSQSNPTLPPGEISGSTRIFPSRQELHFGPKQAVPVGLRPESG